MDKLRIGIAIIVTVIWTAVVITAFAISPDNPQLVTLATIVTPVMLAVVGWLFAEPVLAARRRRNGR